MNSIVFSPFIDVPLTAATVIAFIWHLNIWTYDNDLAAAQTRPRLHSARVKVVLLFAFILLCCWMANLAVWSVFALVFGIGTTVSIFTGAGIYGGVSGLYAAAQIIREWAFGFPTFILHPPLPPITPSGCSDEGQVLCGAIGITTTSLRPTGEALVDGTKCSVVAFDGGWIDAGIRIEVKTYRNGIPCVVPTTETSVDGEQCVAPEPHSGRVLL